MAKIDFEKILIKFLNSPFNRQFDEKLKSALKEQGLKYKDGEIVKTQRRIAAEAKEAIFDNGDEKIRKELKQLISCMHDADPRKKDWLAWLEKQKYTQRDVDDAYLKGVTDTKNELEKQGEQDMIPLDKAIKFLDDQLVDDRDEVTGEPFINFQNCGVFKETFISFFKRKMLEKQDEQILANSVNICKDEHSEQTNFTEFEEALADVCRGWIGDEIGWEDYIVRNADALLKISFKMWNEVQDAPFEQKSDKCDGCNNVKGCVTCVDGDQWAHYKEVEQKPIKMWHDVSEIPYLYEGDDLLVECGTRNYVVKYNPDTKQFLNFRGFPVNGVIRWAYVSDVLSQSVTKISEQVWSEEDENIVYDILYFLNSDKITDNDREDAIQWLKSLKQRLGGK